MDWQSAAIALVSAGLGGFIGVKMSVTRLQTQMESVLERLKTLGERSHDHNDVILIHDGEIAEIMRKLDMDRVPRRRRRDE
jgi:hypothetical protein